MGMSNEDFANEEDVESVVQKLLEAHAEHCYSNPTCDESTFAMPLDRVDGVCDTCGMVFFEGPELIDDGDA